MTRRFCLLSLMAVAAAAGAFGQSPAKSAGKNAASSIPRMPNGKPDMTGVWQGGTTVRGTWEEANRGFGVGGTGQDSNAPRSASSSERHGEPAPYQPWAAKKVLEAYDRRGIDDPAALCLPVGIPRAVTLGLFPIQIVHTPQQFVMLFEYMSAFRVIPIGAKHPADIIPSYTGNAVAHWEGDTLVTDVTGFNDKTWLSGTGTFHTDALHIVERYTMVDRERIDYSATMEDPNVLTKPWTVNSSLMRRDGTQLQEYACAENNLDPAQYEKLLKNGVKFTRE